MKKSEGLKMDARTLESKINYLGMENAARQVLIDEKLAEEEEVAMMTCVEVCERLLESDEVVPCEDEEEGISIEAFKRMLINAPTVVGADKENK